MTTSHSSIIPREEPRHRWNKGYHFGVLCCALTVGIVLFVNVILAIVMTVKNHGSAGTTVVQDGDCDETKRLDLWLHLLINVLSTLLLGASNYSMQCLAAPTRKDIDNAHSQNAWMDIGVLSIRNISRIAWPRKYYGAVCSLRRYRYTFYITAWFFRAPRFQIGKHLMSRAISWQVLHST